MKFGWPFTAWALVAPGPSIGLWSTDTFHYQRSLLLESIAPWQAFWAWMYWIPEQLLFGEWQ